MTNKILTDKPADLNASHYVNHSSLQNNLAKQILSTFQINSNAHILDVGCGDGRITAELATLAKQGKILGIDASPQMIEFAIKSFPHEQFPNLRFLQGMAEEVELPQNYDIIVSFSCFHWLKNPELAINRLSSCLKPNGELLILTYPKESPYYQYLQTALKNYPEYYPYSANHTMLSVAEYKQLLTRNHFNILEFQEQDLMALYNNPTEIREYIKGWLSSYVPLPEALQKSFLEDVSNAILETPTTHGNGKIAIPYTALIIRAKK